jgi:hypothetical protein
VSSVNTYAGSATNSSLENTGVGPSGSTPDSNMTGSPDGVFTTSLSMSSGQNSVSFDTYNFDPGQSGVTYNGISITATMKHGGAATCQIFGALCGLNGVGGAPVASTSVGTNLTTSSATYGFGGSTDLWGISSSNYTDANLNSAVQATCFEFGVWFKNTGGVGTCTGSVDAVQCTTWYTASTPPGAPTGLTAAYNDPTSIALNWTQGSGTVTDNSYRYSTDNATWTAHDIGIAETAQVVPGLTPNTLYYFQVQASNSGGSSSWSTYAFAPTQVTVSQTATLTPFGDGTTTGWSPSTGVNCYPVISDNTDTTYVTPPASTSEPLIVGLIVNSGGGSLDLPPNLICVTGVTLNFRAETTNGSHAAGPTASVTNSGGGLTLVAAAGPGTIATSPTTYNVSGPQENQQSLTQWTDPLLVILAGDTSQDLQLYEVSVTVTYLVPVPVNLVGRGIMIGTAAMMASTR